MQTAGKIARIVFVMLAFVSYARPSLASPTFVEYCSDQCYGNIRWHQCSFQDIWDYPNGPEDESECWEGDYWEDPYDYYWEYCRWLTGHEFFSYDFQSCNDAPTRGNFLCTFEDLGFCT